MNFIDPIILILLAWAAYRGFSKGLVIMFATLIALIIGIWGAIRFYALVSDWITVFLNISFSYMHLVSFTIIFGGIVIGINIAAYLLSRLLDAMALGFMNRLLGGLFGVIKMTLLLSISFVILNAFNTRHDFMPVKQTESSQLYEPVAQIAPELFIFLQLENLSAEIKKLFFDINL